MNLLRLTYETGTHRAHNLARSELTSSAQDDSTCVSAYPVSWLTPSHEVI